MLTTMQNRKIYMASAPVDFRLGINGLSDLIKESIQTHLYDGSVYVFYNGQQDKIKCLFWDGTGFVLYYKRLDQTKFKVKKTLDKITTLTPSELNNLLDGMAPVDSNHNRHRLALNSAVPLQ